MSEYKKIIDTISAIADKTMLGIVAVIGTGSVRFTEIANAIPASEATISKRLKHMESLEWIDRTQEPGIPPAVRYKLTIKAAPLLTLVKTYEQLADSGIIRF